MNPEQRYWDRERIAQSLQEGGDIHEVAKQHGMTDHQLRCIIRAMNALAHYRKETS